MGACEMAFFCGLSVKFRVRKKCTGFNERATFEKENLPKWITPKLDFEQDIHFKTQLLYNPLVCKHKGKWNTEMENSGPKYHLHIVTHPDGSKRLFVLV